MKRKTLMSLLTLLLVFGCSERVREAGNPHRSFQNLEQSQSEKFWSVFNSGNYDEIPHLQLQLEEYLESHPKDGDIRMLYGVSYFWQIAENSRNPESAEVPVLSTFSKTVKELERAKKDAPNNQYLPCFLGLSKYVLAMKLGSVLIRKQAFQEFERGIKMDAPFNTYCRALGRSVQPRDSAEFSEAINDYWKVIGMCDKTVTTAHPVSTDPKASSGCLIRWNVPHGPNGFWLNAGDIFTKAGKLDLARAFYQNAINKYSADWPFQNNLQQQISSIEVRAALYADDNAKNDPPLSINTAHTCVQCHQR